MDIYIDIVYILNTLIYLITLLSTSIILNKQLHFKYCLLVILGFGLYTFSIYLSFNPFFIYLLLIFIMMVILFQKRCLYATIVFFITHTTYIYSFTFIHDGCVIRNQVLLVPISFSWFYAFFLCSLIILIYTGYVFKLKETLTLKQFYYPVKIRYQNKDYEIMGFMDSGNQCVYKDEIVIFVVKNILDISDNHEYLEASTVLANQLIPVVKSEYIIFDNQCFKNVYIGLIEGLDIDDVECLLNMKLIYRG